MRVYLLLALIACAVTYLVTPAARLFSRRIGAMTAVRERDVHTVVTPRLGGVAMWAGIVAAVLLAGTVPFLRPVYQADMQIWGLLGAVTLVCLLGAFDDLWDLDWVTKLAGQVLAAALLAWSGALLHTLPIGGVTVLSTRASFFLTVLVVVVAMNAVNFIDGLDGLAAGVMAIGGGAFFIYAYTLTRSASSEDYSSLATLLTAVLVGVCVGFLPHNAHPARLFMGDSGSMLLGLMLAASTITVTGQVDPAQLSGRDVTAQFLPILLPVAVMLVPMVDFTLAVLRRLAHGQSPMHADRLHLHHRLLNLGHSEVWAASIMYAWAAVICMGVLLPAFVPLRTSLVITAIAMLAALAFTIQPTVSRKRRNG